MVWWEGEGGGGIYTVSNLCTYTYTVDGALLGAVYIQVCVVLLHTAGVADIAMGITDVYGLVAFVILYQIWLGARSTKILKK